MIAEWNKIHPDFPVRMQPIPAGQSSEEVLLAAIAGGTTPDICSSIWPGVMEQYVEAGAVVRLDTMSQFDSLMTSRIPEGMIEGYRSLDMNIYQIPWKSNPILPQYNIGYFDTLGIDAPPETYSEYYKIADKITSDFSDTDSRLRWMHDPNILPLWWQRFFDFYTFYIAASGGRTLLYEGEVDFENETAVKVFEFFARGYRHGYMPRSVFQEDVFLNEKILLHVTGPWNVSYLAKFKPELKYQFGPVPRPDGSEGHAYTFGDPKSIVVFATTPYPQMSWEFVKFMLSRQNDRKLLDITAQLPVRKDLLVDELFSEYFEENPELKIFAEQIPYTVGFDKSPYLQEIFDIISQEYEAACIYDVKTPEKAVADAAKRVRSLINRDR